jgi:photosystem II stability/assembly factor-like uncharacterized protein
MRKVLLLIVLVISFVPLKSQYWQEQVVLEGEVLAFCFDNDENILYSSAMSNGLYAVCKYDIEKDTVVVVLKTKEPVKFLHVCNNGTILGFQDNQVLRYENSILYASKIDFLIKGNMEFLQQKAFDFENGLILYTDDDNGSIFSNDSGKTWQNIILNKNNSLVSPLPNQYFVNLCDSGLYISSDFGLSWEKSNWPDLRIQDFTIADDGKLYILSFTSSSKSIYYSDDFGYNWQKINIQIDTTIQYFVLNDKNIYSLDFYGKLYSYDSETAITTLLTTEPPEGYCAINYLSPLRSKFGLFINGNDEVFYISKYDKKISKFNYHQNKWEVYSQNDLGAFERWIFDENLISHSLNSIAYFKYNHFFHFNTLSNDEKWKAIPIANFKLSQNIDINSMGQLLMGDYNSEFVSDSIVQKKVKYFISSDNGFSWKNNILDFYELELKNNEKILMNHNFASFDENDNIFVIGDDYIYKSIDNGDNFEKICSNFELSDTISGNSLDLKYFDIKKNFGYILSKEQYNEFYIYRTSDNGDSWQKVKPEMNYFNLNNNLIFKTDSEGNIFIFCKDFGPEYLYYSKNYGDTFDIIYGTNHGESLHDFYLADDDVIFCNLISPPETYEAYHFTIKSSDFGESWYRFNDTCNLIASQYGEILAGIYDDNYINNPPRHYIYSTDNGETWEIRKGFALFTLYENPDFISYRTKDYFGDVYKYENETLYKFIRDSIKKENPLNDTTEYTLIAGVEESEIQDELKIKIFPNPSDDIVKINYKLDIPANVKIRIYNSLGEEVAVLINEWQEIGEYEAVFDGRELSSGIYYYCVSIGEYSYFGKMMLMK